MKTIGNRYYIWYQWEPRCHTPWKMNYSLKRSLIKVRVGNEKNNRKSRKWSYWIGNHTCIMCSRLLCNLWNQLEQIWTSWSIVTHLTGQVGEPNSSGRNRLKSVAVLKKNDVRWHFKLAKSRVHVPCACRSRMLEEPDISIPQWRLDGNRSTVPPTDGVPPPPLKGGQSRGIHKLPLRFNEIDNKNCSTDIFRSYSAGRSSCG